MAEDPLSPTFENEIELDRYALSATVYAERLDGNILLLKRAEGSAMAGFFFLPGGLVDPGENPWDAAARELLEESGLELTSPLEMVGCYPMFIYGRDFLQLTFRGSVSGDVEISSEHTEHEWVTPTNWAALFTPEAIRNMAGENEQIAHLLTGIGDDARRYLAIVS